MKRIFVTGASGFIGRRAVAALEKRGFHVLADRVELFDGDAVRAYLSEKKPTHLLHLAWVTDSPAFWTSTENLRWLAASLDLVRSFVEAGGKHTVVAGSCAEYAWDGTPCDEERTPLTGATLYAACKNALNLASSRYCADAGVRFAWGRVFFVYGGGESPKKFLSSVLARLRRGETAELREPARRLDYVHVNDVASAFALLAASEAAGAFNIGTGEGDAVLSLAAAAANLAGRPELIALSPSTLSEPDVIADIEKMRRLGWDPVVRFEHGIRELYTSGVQE